MTGALRVLIIDDSEEYRDIITEAMRSQGWDPRACEDGASGLERARELRPSLVIMDVALPDTDGYALCRELRGDPALKDIPVIMVTGTYREDEDRERGMEAGADDYVVKPFRLMELIDKAKALVKAHGGKDTAG